jgi:hypothetical protein
MLQVADLGLRTRCMGLKRILLHYWRWQGQVAQAAVPWQDGLVRTIKTQSTRGLRSIANEIQEPFLTLVVPSSRLVREISLHSPLVDLSWIPTWLAIWGHASLLSQEALNLTFTAPSFRYQRSRGP